MKISNVIFLGLTLSRIGQSLLAMSQPSTVNPQNFYYHADGYGNITTMINTQQIIVAKYLYDPFGNTLSLSGPMAAVNLYRFSSKEYLPNAGLYYFGRRFYDSNLQRWVNRDPIDESGGLNLFAYVENSPLNKNDPFGLEGNPIKSFTGAWNSDPYGPGGGFYGPGSSWKPGLTYTPSPYPTPTYPQPGPEMSWNQYSGTWYLDAGIQTDDGIFAMLTPFVASEASIGSKFLSKCPTQAVESGTKLLGSSEYVISDANTAMQTQSSLLRNYAANAPNPGIDLVEGLTENAQIDTVSGRISLSSDLVANYPHLIDGTVTEELFHFQQLQASGLLGGPITAAQNQAMEAGVVSLLLKAGFKKY